MHVVNPWQSYRQISTLTAPPGQIILMLFDGALRTLERALSGFSHEDPAEANMIIHNNLQRAQEIIRELNYALNMDQGGDCAATLRKLYARLTTKGAASDAAKDFFRKLRRARGSFIN